MHEMIAVELGTFLKQYEDDVSIHANEMYKLVTISKTGVVSLREEKKGINIKADKAYRVRGGSFIYSRLAAHTGAFGLVPAELDGAVVTNEMPTFEINDKIILPDYLIHLFRQRLFLNMLYQLTKGMGRVRIKEEFFLRQRLSIHKSVSDQKKMLDSINSSFDKIDALSSTHLEQIDYLKYLRQSILQEAIAGNLTSEWRRQNPHLTRGENHASKLLAKIQVERDILVSKGKMRKEKILTPPSDEETKMVLPEGWVWCKFGNYALFERGRFSIRPRNDKSCYGGKYPFIQIGSLSANGDVITDFKQTLNDKGFSVSKQFVKGTIAVAIVGGTIGNLGVLGMDMCFPDSMIGIKPTSHSNQDYILMLLRSKQPEIKKAAYQMAGQPNIQLPTLMNLVIPLPPIWEQRIIVARVNELMAMIYDLEKQVIERECRTELLTQAVLREAFEHSHA